MLKRLKKPTLILLIITLLILYLFNANLIVDNIINYTTLFITKLFPSTFIYFILSSLLIDLGLINYLNKLHLNGSIFYVTIISLISGIPSGAKTTTELYKKKVIDENVANYLLTYTNFPNPLFILGSISTILNKELAFKILLTLIISNLIISIILKPKNKTYYNISNNNITFSNSLAKSIISTLKIISIIYGSSLFFYLISIIINHYFILNNYFYIIINSLFDLTNGLFSTCLISNIYLRSLLILFFFSFGSISIHSQIKSIISNTPLKYSYFLLGRLLQVMIAIPLFILLSKI